MLLSREWIEATDFGMKVQIVKSIVNSQTNLKNFSIEKNNNLCSIHRNKSHVQCPGKIESSVRM